MPEKRKLISSDQSQITKPELQTEYDDLAYRYYSLAALEQNSSEGYYKLGTNPRTRII